MLKNILKDELRELKIEMEENKNYLSNVGEKQIKRYERQINKINIIIKESEEQSAKTNIAEDLLNDINESINEARQRIPTILYKKEIGELLNKIDNTIDFLNSTNL